MTKRIDPNVGRDEEKRKLIEREANGRVHSGPQGNTNDRLHKHPLHPDLPASERERIQKLGREKMAGRGKDETNE